MNHLIKITTSNTNNTKYTVDIPMLKKELLKPINHDNIKILLSVWMLFSFDPHKVYVEYKAELDKRLRGLISQQIALEVLADLKKNNVDLNTFSEFLIKSIDAKDIPEKREIVTVDNTNYYFNELECLDTLNGKWTKPAIRELFQSYYLIQCIKLFGLNAYDKNGRKIVFADNFLNILNYEQNILDKVKNTKGFDVSYSTLQKYILMLTNIHFGKENDIKIFNEVIPEISTVFNLSMTGESDMEKDVIILFNNLISFNEIKCEELLRKKSNEHMEIELVQSLFVFYYNKFFKNTKSMEPYFLNSNIEKIDSYKEEIVNKLKSTLSEDEIESYIKRALFRFDEKNTQIVLDTLSLELDAKLHKSSDYNDVLFLQYDSSGFVTNISFRENVCEKLLLKKTTETTIREFTQVYFMYIYSKRIKTPLLNKAGKTIHMPENMNNIDLYIDLIDKKLNGIVKEDIFDKSVNLVISTMGLDSESRKEMDNLVIYPMKRRFGINKTSLFKHVL